MDEIIARYKAQYGYAPTLYELWVNYTDGTIDTISDENEQALIDKAEEMGYI